VTVVVTGASGHIGANLVRDLVAVDRRVRVLVHRNRRPLEGLDVEVAAGDVLDPGSVADALRDAEVVYHLAGVISLSERRAPAIHAVNVAGTANVLRAAARSGVRRLVHCSSIHAYDLRGARRVDEHTPQVPEGSRHHSAYDRSKAAGERMVRAAVERGLDAVIVNPTSVIGPSDFEPSRMGRFFLAFARGRLPALVRGGFDFVDVRDVSAALQAAAVRGRPGEGYLVGGHFRTVVELGAMAAAATGRPAPRLAVPLAVARLAAPAAEAIARRSGTEPLFGRGSLAVLRAGTPVDSGRAAAELGHRPRDTADTVRAVYDWFVSMGWVERPGPGR
jgi:dihydroflavonol-4-reductase